MGWIVGIFALLLGVMLIIVGAALIATISNYIYLYAVLKDKTISESIKLGWQLFKKNVAPTIIMGLITIGIGIGVSLVIVIIVLFLLMIFGGIGFAIYLLSKSWIVIGIIIFLAILVLFIISIFARGVLNVFVFSSWYITWKQLIDKK